MPTHRRQGVLRSLMARQLADVRERGEPMAALWASEGSIYQRFGYGLATTNGSIEIERDRATFRKPNAATGIVELRDIDAARPALVKIYDAVRATTPGFYERKPAWWDVVLSDAEFRRRGAGKRFNAILSRDGEDVGYVLYRIKGEWLPTGPANTLIVLELLGLDADAVAQLWRYVFGVDLMSHIRSRLGPPDHPLLLMVAEPRRLQLRVGDALWLRIVDVPKALEARGYAADGSIVIEVTDDFMPEVAGRWRLTVEQRHGTRREDDRSGRSAARDPGSRRGLPGWFPPSPVSAERTEPWNARTAPAIGPTRSSPPRSCRGAPRFFRLEPGSAEQRNARRSRPVRFTVVAGCPAPPISFPWPLRDDQTISTRR